jgi:hypothetical protein
MLQADLHIAASKRSRRKTPARLGEHSALTIPLTL